MANGNFGGGDGTKENPYLVDDAADLAAIDAKNGDGDYYHYLQTKDIDLAGITHTPIGGMNGPPFKGEYDGGCKKVLNLTSDMGLFFILDGGGVKNIRIIDASVNSPGGPPGGILCSMIYEGVSFIENIRITGEINAGNAGMLAGRVSGDSSNPIKISNCQLEGLVSGYNVGGIASYLKGVSMDKCYFNGSITSPGGAGGVVADSSDNIFTDVYAECDITAYEGSGGFAGNSEGSVYLNCYASSIVIVEGSFSGGFVGRSDTDTFTNCYADGAVTAFGWGGGFVARISWDSEFNQCFADVNVEIEDTWAGGFVPMSASSALFTDCSSHGSVTGLSFVFGFGNDDVTSKTFVNCRASNNAVITTETELPYSGTFGYEESDKVYSDCFYNGGMSYNNPDFALLGILSGATTPLKFGEEPDYQKLFDLLACVSVTESHTKCRRVLLAKILKE